MVYNFLRRCSLGHFIHFKGYAMVRRFKNAGLHGHVPTRLKADLRF